MNDDTVDSRERRRRWPQLAAALVMAAGIALLAAACGSGPSSSSGDPSQSGGSTTYQQDLAYAQCMRSHGVPNFPDASSNGTFAINGINLESGSGKAAENTCKHLLPNGGVVPAAQQQQRTRQLLVFAECMRSHGEPKFPDPTNKGLNFRGTGIDPQSPQFQAAQQACQSVKPTLGATTGTGGGS